MASNVEFRHNIVNDFALIRVVVPLRPSQIRDELTKPKFCSENDENDQTLCWRLKVKNTKLNHIIMILWKGDAESY